MTRQPRQPNRRPRPADDDEPEERTPAPVAPDFVDRRQWIAADATMWGDTPRGDLESMGDVLDVVLGRFAGSSRSTLQQIVEAWDGIAGGGWERARPVRLDGETLVVEVPDGLTASRLQFDATRFVGVMRDVAGGVVRRITFRVARE